MKKKLSSLIALANLLSFGVAEAKMCTKWAPPQVIGYLNHDALREQSGFTFSKNGKNLFHVKDGRVSELYATDLTGGQLKRIPIADYTGSDVEELFSATVGNETYLILADVGDNRGRREYLRLAVVDENAVLNALENESVDRTEMYDVQQSVYSRTVYFSYPDGPKNSEAMAFHPNGDLYVVSKSSERGSVDAAKVYRLEKNAWLHGKNSSRTPSEMEYIGELQVPKINNDAPDGFGKIVTGMDISSDGKTLVVATYQNAIEFDLDLSKYSKKKQIPFFGVKSSRIDFQRLTQQEAVKYTPDNSGIIVTTEYDPGLGQRSGAQYPDSSPMLLIQCLNK